MHQVFASVDAMTGPAALSEVLGRPVGSVDRTPLTPRGHSSTGATFEGVRVDGEASPSLVVKMIDRATDWVAVATGDVTDREVSAWESGLLDRLPAGMGHAVVAAARFAGGSAILMRNRSDDFMTDDDSLPPARNTALLRSVASMHDAFWRTRSLTAPIRVCARWTGSSVIFRRRGCPNFKPRSLAHRSDRRRMGDAA